MTVSNRSSPILLLLLCLVAVAATQEENVVCARRPQVVSGPHGQALNFLTGDPGMFEWSNSSTIPNGPHPFLGGASGTLALTFKGTWLSKARSVLVALGSHRDGMFEDCDGIIPAKSSWPGEGFELSMQALKPTGEGRVVLYGCSGGTDYAIEPSAVIDLKAWHHVAMVWQPGAVELYVDGRPAGRARTPATNDFALARSFRIASDLYGGNGFNGALCGISAWSRAFTPDGIAALAAGRDATGDAALTLSMPCDGTTAARVMRGDLAGILAGQTVFRAGLGSQRFAPVGAPIPMSLTVAPGTGTPPLTAEIVITAADGKPILHETAKVPDDPAHATGVAFTATPGRCGMHQLELTVKDARGVTVFARAVRFGVIAPLPTLAETPDSSPSGYWSDTSRSSLGFKWVRLWDACGCSWTALEPRKGEYHWDYLDAVLQDAAARGVRPLLCLAGTPAWASSMRLDGPVPAPTVDGDGYARISGAGWAGTAASPPRDLADFERFVRALARRYKGRIPAYECWNEPDTSHFTGTAEQYVALLTTMHRVLHEEDPAALLVGGVGSGYPPWTERIFALGAPASMDVLSIHTYCMLDPVIDHRDGSLGHFITWLHDAQPQGRALPVWGDELGTTYSSLDKAAFVKEYGGETATPGGVISTYAEQSIRWDIGMMLALVGMGDRNKCFPGGTNNAHYDDKAIAYAAFSSVVGMRTAARFIPVNDQAMGVLLDCAATAAAPGPRAPGSAPRAAGPYRIAALTGSGSAVFRMACPRVAGMDIAGNPLSFPIRDGLLKLDLHDELVYLLDVPADFAGVQVVALSVPRKSTAGQALPGVATLRNPFVHAQAFNLSARLPKDWSIAPATATVQVAAGGSATVPLSLTSGTSSGDVDLEILASTAGGDAFTCRSRIFNLAVLPLQAYTGPLEAAREASWSAAPLIATIDDVEHVAIGRLRPEFPDMPHWSGKADLSYTIRGGWRADGVYLWIDVTDDRVHPGSATSAPWNMDAVEIFTDLVNDHDLRGDRTNTEQIVIVPQVGEHFAPCAVALCNGGSNGRAKFYGRRSDHGYIVAGRIYFRNYSRLHAGTWLGLDVKVDDCDDPAARDQRKASMAWMGDEHDASSSAKWGSFVLSGTADEVPQSSVGQPFQPLLQRLSVNGVLAYQSGQAAVALQVVEVDPAVPVTLECTFVNQGKEPAEADFNVFIQTEGGGPMAGGDYRPMLPTSAWATGRPAVDVKKIDLSALAGSTTTLLLGLYLGGDRITLINPGNDYQQRLPVATLHLKGQPAKH